MLTQVRFQKKYSNMHKLKYSNTRYKICTELGLRLIKDLPLHCRGVGVPFHKNCTALVHDR